MMYVGPRSEEGRILRKASQMGILHVTYVRLYTGIKTDVHYELQPSILGSTNYGGEDSAMTVIRRRLSFVVALRMRAGSVYAPTRTDPKWWEIEYVKDAELV